MSTCFGCETQTVYSCLNRNEITENRHQKLKPNRTEKNLNRGSPSRCRIKLFTLSSDYHHMHHCNNNKSLHSCLKTAEFP